MIKKYQQKKLLACLSKQQKLKKKEKIKKSKKRKKVKFQKRKNSSQKKKHFKYSWLWEKILKSL